jgi:hypothetical protein
VREVALVALAAACCTTPGKAAPSTLQLIEARRHTAAPACVERFRKGERTNAAVVWQGCVAADAFMSPFRATAVHVTIRLREPLSLVTRANLINAGVPASTAAAWAELDHGRPVLAVAAHVEIDQLH